jgi:hypothetical protein
MSANARIDQAGAERAAALGHEVFIRPPAAGGEALRVDEVETSPSRIEIRALPKREVGASRRVFRADRA